MVLPTYLLTDLPNLPTYTHLPTHLPTYLPTYPPTYLPTYLSTYPPTYLPTYPPTYLHTSLYVHTCSIYLPGTSLLSFMICCCLVS